MKKGVHFFHVFNPLDISVTKNKAAHPSTTWYYLKCNDFGGSLFNRKKFKLQESLKLPLGKVVLVLGFKVVVPERAFLLGLIQLCYSVHELHH